MYNITVISLSFHRFLIDYLIPVCSTKDVDSVGRNQPAFLESVLLKHITNSHRLFGASELVRGQHEVNCGLVFFAVVYEWALLMWLPQGPQKGPTPLSVHPVHKYLLSTCWMPGTFSSLRISTSKQNKSKRKLHLIPKNVWFRNDGF